ncbi:MAG: Crp/Fnr family transcriptional regulator [Eubacteriales bacterium]|nr:Crp/Fnr family transcriptional regulator [Eubacteriales bacterium]
MKNIFDGIGSIKLLEGLTADELNHTLDPRGSCTMDYTKGQIIHLEKEDCRFIDIILEGRVSVLKIDEDGNILVIGTFNRGDVIGVNLIFSARNHYPFHVMAASQTTILHLDKGSILGLCKSSQIFMIHLLEAMSDRSLILTDKINSIAMKTIRQKILEFLELEQIRQNSDVVTLSLTKKEMAEKFGVQRTSLSRELNKMRKENLISYNSKEIIVNILYQKR